MAYLRILPLTRSRIKIKRFGFAFFFLGRGCQQGESLAILIKGSASLRSTFPSFLVDVLE
jgi:hypothetical protein